MENMTSFNKEEFDCHIFNEGFTAKGILNQKISEVSSSEDNNVFYVTDLGDIRKKHLRWLKLFPVPCPNAHCDFDMGTEFGFCMCLLDIDGGFPGSENMKLKFEKTTSVIKPALDKYFPPDSGVRVTAESGRYYVVSAFTLAVNIISKEMLIQSHDFPPEVEEQDIGTLPMSCAQKSSLCFH
ncbi:hypothetical protein U0070_015306 [Myodes glareolus]|uniref:ornithine decarboxylase n=1 Tax=Myodes glareolus TaxID=447135 RepID=A0AAW0JYL3_MYOGA